MTPAEYAARECAAARAVWAVGLPQKKHKSYYCPTRAFVMASRRKQVQAIVDVVARETGLSAETICGKARDAEVTAARLEVYQRAREAGIGSTAISGVVNRDPSTIRYAMARAKA